jgi:hypothetical protein
VNALLLDSAPFIVSIAMMLTIGALELIALLIGFSFTERAGGMLAAHFGLDPHGAEADAGLTGQCLAWLHVGRVPLLVVLILLLLGFSIAGLALQYAVHACFGVVVKPAIAVVFAIPCALFFAHRAGGFIGKFVPSIQSSALSEADFVGAVAQIVTGSASRGVAAQARLVDKFGQPHYVRVEPVSDDAILVRGIRIVLVEQVSSSLYLAVAL